MGHLGNRRVRPERARRRRRSRRRRAGLRHCVLLRLAREARRPPVGVDITPAQLDDGATPDGEDRHRVPARRGRRRRHRSRRTRASTSRVSEYGASIWVDPYRWIPEAARLLRPGGRLVFLRNSTLVILCSDDEVPAKEHLVHAQFGMKRFEWPDGGVEFHLATRRVDRPAARERIRDRAARRDSGARPTRSRTSTTATSPPSGPGSGPARRSGHGSGSHPASPRLDVAAEARDPRTAADPVRGRRARLRGGRRAPRRSTVPRARRGRSTEASGRCSASTPRCCSAASCSARRRTRATPRRCSRRFPAVRTRSSPGSACARKRGRSCTRSRRSSRSAR